MGNWKQLCILRSLSLDKVLCFLWRDDTSTVFPAGSFKCPSQCSRTVTNICTGSLLIVTANFLCPTAIRHSQKPLKLRDGRPESHAEWRRLMLMNIMSNAARVNPKSVRWHRLLTKKVRSIYIRNHNLSIPFFSNKLWCRWIVNYLILNYFVSQCMNGFSNITYLGGGGGKLGQKHFIPGHACLDWDPNVSMKHDLAQSICV